MGLNTIELPAFLLEELYGEALLASPVATTTASSIPPAAPVTTAMPTAVPVTTATPTVKVPPAGPATYKFLGHHQRKISILVNSPGSAFLPDDQLAFLTKILEACKMNIGDVAIVNHATLPIRIAALRQQLNPATILLFGLSPTEIELPIDFPSFKLQPYDQCTYLHSPALKDFVAPTEEAKLLKSKLWVTLRTLFEI